jgi:senataxin
MELPELDSLYSIICNWNYYRDLSEDEVIYKNMEDDNIFEDIKKNELEKVPIRFPNCEEYIRIFRNHFMVESKAQITRSKQVELEKSETFSLIYCHDRKPAPFHIFELTRLKSHNIVYSTNDLIVISQLPPGEGEHDAHLLGIVERMNMNALFAKVMITDVKRGQAMNQTIKKFSEWYVTRICNLATINREFQALYSIDNLKLKETIIQPGNISEMLEPDDYFNIPKHLDSQLNMFFNYSQIDALKSSIKKRGITLIQGPPGTGKTTAILGILSVILNSSIKKEPQLRKDSLITSTSKEFNFTEQKISDYSKQHPWLYNENYKNWMDEPIPIDDGFLEYPTAKETDTFTDLNKPLDNDISPPERILVCAPSNVAIDEIVRKIMTVGLINDEGVYYQPKFIRIGPNYHPSLKEVSLDYMITQRVGKEDTKDYDKIRNELLSGVKIVCSTLSMAGSNILTNLNQKFDTVLIDEAAQAVEISTLIPLKYMCERLILVGDPKQLSATVFSRTAMKNGYDQSLFKRLQEAGHDVTILKTQYRMHKTISKFISDTFYNGLLDDDPSIEITTSNEKHHLSPAFQPLTFYDFEAEENFLNNSYYNEAQVIVICELVKKLMEIYSPIEIVDKLAIISPYSIQVSIIKDRLKQIPGFEDNPIEVNTVDGFQGREKSIILFSTVRSKGSKTIGFLSEERRMNVGLSRSKSCLVVVGDSRKLITDDNWDKLVRYAFRNATFYKIKGSIKEYFSNFDVTYKKYLVKDEQTFVKMVFNK